MLAECVARILNKTKPFLAVMFLQFGYAGMSILGKFALNEGMSPHVLAAYRHAFATLFIAPFAVVFERKVRPKMTLSIFIKILLLGLLEPTIDQNMYYTGMSYTTATFTAAMGNVLPAFAFLMAWICRLEKVNLKSMHGQAKILGTIVTVGGAMLMTLVKGPMIPFPWTKPDNASQSSTSSLATKQDPIKGGIFITIGAFCWSGFIVLQAITLRDYPAALSLTALICLMGTIEGTIVAFAIERGNLDAWSLRLDAGLVAAVYSGVICSGIAFYIQGKVMKTRGPVFVTAFNPLSMIIVAIIGSFVLAEITYLGRVLGALVIVVGLYMVLWGKSKDRGEPSRDNDKALPTSNQQLNLVAIEASPTTKQDAAAVLDGTRVRPTDEAV